MLPFAGCDPFESWQHQHFLFAAGAQDVFVTFLFRYMLLYIFVTVPLIVPVGFSVRLKSCTVVFPEVTTTPIVVLS